MQNLKHRYLCKVDQLSPVPSELFRPHHPCHVMLEIHDRNYYLLIVQDSISHINQQLPDEQQISKEPNTVLVGPNSELDSLSVINLIIEVEERIYTSYGKRIQILDLGPGTQCFASARAKGNVGVATELSFFHVGIGYIDVTKN